MTGVTVPHPVAQHNEVLLKIKIRQAHGCLDNNSMSDVAGTLRKTLDVEGPCPTIVGHNFHWRVLLLDARPQNVGFTDPFWKWLPAKHYQRDHRLLQHNSTWILAFYRVDYEIASLGRHTEVWYMGNKNTGAMEAILEPK
ncbi:TPA: hypothetical protein ACH3X1_002718 [Trebouxia sp. C0004]